LACCNDELFDRLIDRHRRNGRVPARLQESQGKGHNNRNIFFCPKCGTQLGNITVEQKVRLEDGSEDIIQSTEFGCPQCNHSYEKELQKYKDNHR
jgi:RNase P subunit RPR2